VGGTRTTGAPASLPGVWAQSVDPAESATTRSVGPCCQFIIDSVFFYGRSTRDKLAVASCLRRRRRMSPRHRRTGVDLQPRVKSRRGVGNAPATLADEPAVHLGSSPPLSPTVLSCPPISHSILLAHCLILSRTESQCRAVVSSTTTM
jgi:hypothetical protein